MSQNQILFFIFLFCLNPFLGTLSLLIVKMMINKRDTNSDFLVFLFITLFACLLQYTRIWDTNQPSDWYNDGYWGLFLRVSDTSFVEYIIGAYKEPVWNLLNYIGYYITRGNYLRSCCYCDQWTACIFDISLLEICKTPFRNIN